MDVEFLFQIIKASKCCLNVDDISMWLDDKSQGLTFYSLDNYEYGCCHQTHVANNVYRTLLFYAAPRDIGISNCISIDDNYIDVNMELYNSSDDYKFQIDLIGLEYHLQRSYFHKYLVPDGIKYLYVTESDYELSLFEPQLKELLYVNK